MHPGTEESIAPPDGVRIRAPARLHFGFLDLHGGLGRRYSSLGLSLEQPATALRLRRAPTLRVSGPDSDRVRDCARRLAERLGLPAAAEITVEQAIPAHAGLGSGTQLALAVGLGLARLYRRALAAREAAVLLGRGARSGIGVGAFEQGGFLIDGGHGPDTAVPPIICRLPFPEDWRLLLVYDPARAGLSGESEREAFARLPVFPPERAAQLCRLVLIRLLPALAEGDAAGFGAALAELQRQVGDHFAPVQGGRYASPDVAAVLAWLAEQGTTGGGQSSWGPTGFALCPDPALGARLLAAARSHWPGLGFDLCRARNTPAGATDIAPPAADRPATPTALRSRS